MSFKDKKTLIKALAILYLGTFLIFGGGQWVGTKIIGLPLTGGTMTGNITMSGADIDLNGNNLIIDADGDSKLYEESDDNIILNLLGAPRWHFASTWFGSYTAGQPAIQRFAAGPTQAGFTPNRTDADTGPSWVGTDIAGMTSGGVIAQAWPEVGGVITHVRSGLTTRFTSEAVADEAEILLATGVSGWGQVMAGDNEEWAHFRFSADGTVTLITNTANVVNTDTDTKFCIYDAGSGIGVKNRLGSSKTVAFTINYY